MTVIRMAAALTLVGGGGVMMLTGCSTYRTLDPAKLVEGHTEPVDQTKGHYGQPYFLPKGLIHLVIKPEGTGGGGGDSSGAAAANNNNNVITINNAAQQEKAGGGTVDDGTSPQAYKITVDRILVPDPLAGPYFARYEQNWLYAEGVSVGVTDDGLLSTLSTTSSDRTAQIISNLADTAINVGKFIAQGGVGGGSVKTKMAADTPKFPKVRYKRLNIDVTFDPLDAEQVLNVQRLFKTMVVENDLEGDTVLVSPLKFAMKTPAQQGHALKERSGKEHGLWFRETLPLTFEFRQNPEEFRSEVRKIINDVRRAAGAYGEALSKAKRDAARSEQEVTKANEAVAAANNSGDKTKIDEANKALKTASDIDQEKRDAVNVVADPATAAQVALKSLNETANSQAISRTATFVKSVPNPQRVFAFNIARSAFVQNKKIDLTISNGLLTKVSLDKKSEIEGFTEIPLNLSQKLAALPKDLLTVRTEKVTAQKGLIEAQKNAFNEKAALEDLTAGREDAAAVAKLKADTDRLNAEANLINAQNALKKARQNQ